MGETGAQKKARREQEQAAESAKNQRVKTMQQDLTQQTNELFRRFGSFGAGRSGSFTAPMGRDG
jgi:hypothetical protein